MSLFKINRGRTRLDPSISPPPQLIFHIHQSPKMSAGISQQNRMAKCPPDLEMESWYDGPPEIKDDWVILKQGPKIARDQKPKKVKEQSDDESETGIFITEMAKKVVQNGAKTDNKKSKKLRKHLDITSYELGGATITGMAISWLKKALGPSGISSTAVNPAQRTIRNKW